MGFIDDFATSFSLMLFLVCVLVIVGIITYLWVTDENGSNEYWETNESEFYELRQMLERNENIGLHQNSWPSLVQTNKMRLISKRSTNSI